MQEVKREQLIEYINKIYDGKQDGYVFIMIPGLPNSEGKVLVDNCLHNINPKIIIYFLQEEQKRLVEFLTSEDK